MESERKVKVYVNSNKSIRLTNHLALKIIGTVLAVVFLLGLGYWIDIVVPVFLLSVIAIWLVSFFSIRAVTRRILIYRENRLQELERTRQREIERQRIEEEERRIREEERQREILAELARRNTLAGRAEYIKDGIADKVKDATYNVSQTADGAVETVKFIGRVGQGLGKILLGEAVSNIFGGNRTWVDPYRRGDGTRVKGYWRRK